MIRSNELRLGNWINIKSGDHFKQCEIEYIGRISYIGVVFLGFSYDSKIEDVSGIPITPEWLQRFGFNDDPCPEFDTDMFMLKYNDSCFEMYLYPETEGAITIKDFKYIHQLENLYFSLTGEELKMV